MRPDARGRACASGGALTDRRLILGLLALAGLGLLAAAPALAEDVLSIASYGGVLQDAETKAMFEPAAKEIGVGVKVYAIQGTARIATIRAQEKANAPTFDVMEYFAGVCEQLSRDGLTEPLDFAVIKTDGIPPEFVGKNWVGIDTYSTLLSYNTKTFGDKGPATWAEFWDVKRFPGRRALNPTDVTAEIALLADGVPADKLYPLDIDRVFRKLNEIKPYITVWWTTGAQATQLAKDQEVDTQSIWQERAEDAIKAGAPITYTWKQGLLGTNCMVVPKGAPHKELAMKLIAGVVSPELQANLPQYTSSGPVNRKAFETGKITAEQAKELNTAPQNVAQQIVQNLGWWADHGAKMQMRFRELLQ